MSPLVSQAEELIASGNSAHAMLSSLHPRLFRGVTPNRHAGETSLTVVRAWLAHSGYPAWKVA